MAPEDPIRSVTETEGHGGIRETVPRWSPVTLVVWVGYATRHALGVGHPGARLRADARRSVAPFAHEGGRDGGGVMQNVEQSPTPISAAGVEWPMRPETWRRCRGVRSDVAHDVDRRIE